MKPMWEHRLCVSARLPFAFRSWYNADISWTGFIRPILLIGSAGANIFAARA
jgi:hypothetical protein